MKSVLPVSLLVGFALALSGCALEPVPPCPEVRIDAATAGMTVFKEGDGRDITDIAYQAEIVSFTGSCSFDDDGVEVVMDMDIIINSGPAVQPGRADLHYFVAIPRFHPDPVGKKIFTRRYRLTESSTRRERITESNIRIYIPLDDKLQGASYDVYLGFQLTDEQLEYNRSRRG